MTAKNSETEIEKRRKLYKGTVPVCRGRPRQHLPPSRARLSNLERFER